MGFKLGSEKIETFFDFSFVTITTRFIVGFAFGQISLGHVVLGIVVAVEILEL